MELLREHEMPDSEVARELATHAIEIAYLKQSNERILAELQALRTQLTAVQNTLSEARGGWRALMLVGGASASFGALLSEILGKVMK